MLLNNVIFSHSKREAHQWLPALIGAIGSLAGGAISAISQKKQNQRNVQTSKDLMDYQWQNYGSPAAQLAAYHSAGLNPNASSQMLQQPQSQIPDQLAPGVVFGSQFSSFIQPFVQLLSLNSQLRNIQAQTDQTETATEGIRIDNDLKRFDLGEIKPEELKLLQRQISQTEAGTHLTRAQIKQAAFQILKTKAETQGIDLQNRFQEMENEWKRIQGDKRLPENQSEWQRLQNERIQQQMTIDSPNSEIAKVRTKLLKSLEQCFDTINSTQFAPNSNFMGIPLNKDTLPFMRAIVNMLLYKVVTQF